MFLLLLKDDDEIFIIVVTAAGVVLFGGPSIVHSAIFILFWSFEISGNISEKSENIACVHGPTNGIPISFKVLSHLPKVPLVIPLVPIVPLIKTEVANIADNLQCGQNYQRLKVT